MKIQQEKLASVILCFLFIFLSIPSFCQVNLQDKLPVDSNVKIGKLENGLTYYIRKNAKPEIEACAV